MNWHNIQFSIQSSLLFYLILLTPLTLPTAVSGKKIQPQQWCSVVDDYVVVEDKLFNYIKKFTPNGGKRHFLYTVAMVESRMNPYSAGGSFGELGMMQVLPDTGSFVSRRAGKNYDLTKVRGNIYASLEYLDFILAKIDQHCPPSFPLDDKVELMAAAYNGGAGHIAKGCSLKHYNCNARKYAQRFMGFWKKKYTARSYFKNQTKYVVRK
ncbi:MAG: transglycosylase SLT domain-containing protein [Thermodesulfobacteriota bacterium]|nr:transglycosylase SLT domain-containing protein [Thermodesulfobacteriota bacterium]